MVKEPAGTLIITTPAELLNSEVGDLDMTIYSLNTSSTESLIHRHIAVASSAQPLCYCASAQVANNLPLAGQPRRFHKFPSAVGSQKTNSIDQNTENSSDQELLTPT